MTPNPISVDVEEYFHVASLAPYIPVKQWESMPSRVESAIFQILELFEASNTLGTFFILSPIAEKHPSLIQEIQRQGHEIASHGQNHKFVFHQTEKEFFDDIEYSKKLLEDLIGSPVSGYRAPNFSITDKTPWAFDCIAKAGYQYDSSIYPIWHKQYGNRNFQRHPLIIQTTTSPIIEYPMATASFFAGKHELRLPIAGGAYWRLFPLPIMNWLFQQTIKKENTGHCCYFHPWEIDPDQPQVSKIDLLTKIRHYGGLKSFHKKLQHFLSQYSFAPISTVLQSSYTKLWESITE